MASFTRKHPARTVAIIGPDGAGKSTLIDRLERELPYRLKRIYMGINPDAATHALPTTRLFWFLRRRLKKSAPGYRHDGQAEPRPERSQPLHKRLLREVKSAGFVFSRVSEQWYRQSVCWYYQWRGNLVLLDRHFYLDHLAVKLSGADSRTTLAWRVHNLLLERFYPRPHMTLYLDAPPHILYERKQEVSIARLEAMRKAYDEIRQRVPCFESLDATRTAEQVFEAARAKIAAIME